MWLLGEFERGAGGTLDALHRQHQAQRDRDADRVGKGRHQFGGAGDTLLTQLKYATKIGIPLEGGKCSRSRIFLCHASQ